MAAIHQVVPRLERGAVGTHVLQARAALRAAGHASDVFAAEVDERLAATGALGIAEFERHVGACDVVVYQHAIGTPLADWLARRTEPLVVNYHNLTPAALLEPWEPALGHAVTWGRRQLASLAGRAALGLAVSRYNEEELRRAGYRATATVPVLLDPSLLDGPPDAPTLERLRSRQGSAWLFVGRLAPNKAQHDVVKAFALYRRSHDPAAVLWLIGAPAPERYAAALRGYIDALGLSDAVELRGDATTAELGAYYRAADVFVCLSDHEGFCVPLLEAWAHELPIVAYASSAVPETVGDAGVLLADKPAGTVAAAVDRVVRDAALRGALVGRGARRLASTFAPERVRGEFVQALERVA